HRQLAYPDTAAQAGWAAARRHGRTRMQDRKPTSRSPLRIILWSLIAAFVLFYGGYHLGKDMALRDNARQSAGR
ncbi:hypothetical protein AB1A96_15240, partial [Pseudomonas juntendi]|uniref:hypothetical protein n=1 Tax=Pseudomonas juntendi TaxID=2666183 RepID=UPI003451BE85